MKYRKLIASVVVCVVLVASGCIESVEKSISSEVESSLEKAFDNPPESARPSGYWWWLNANVDKDAITRDLENFRDKGMGSVLLVSSGNWSGRMPVRGPAFLSDEWMELFKFALKEAHRLDIKVDVNIAPGWNMGGPWITKEKSNRWFLQSQMTIRGPQEFSGKLPQPGSIDGYNSKPQLGVRHSVKMLFEELDYRDNAVVAFRTPENAEGNVGPNKRDDLPAKSNRLDADCFIPAEQVMSQTLGQWTSSRDDKAIDPKDVIDLTENLKADGTLHWDVPAGDWTIIRTGHRTTGAMLSVPMPDQGGLENDFLDRGGVELMFENTAKLLIEAAGSMAGNTLRGFCSDSFEAGYPNWTDKMLSHFKKYRGYDPTPYLPVFKGWIIGSAEISERFLHDYRKTVADCLADEHYGRFDELCQEYGLLTRCESAGPSWSGTFCMDGLKNLGRVDFPQGEFWRGELFKHKENGENMVCKQTATASHIYGIQTASAEAFTIGGNHWTAYPEILKPEADQAFCDGINYFVFHTVTCQRPVDGKPGYEYGAGTHFNPNVTWWDLAAGPWVSYINRCQAMLQSGLFVADVLYYNGDWAPNLVGPRNITHNPGKGYDYDVCNAEVLIERVSVRDGKLVLPDGMSYHLLILPDADRMPVEVARKIESLVKAGATVLGPKPLADPGLKDYPNCDKLVSDIGDSLWGDLDGKDVVERKVGKGRVVFGKSPGEILMANGIVPDIEIAGQEETYIDYIHRATADADLYFLANRKDRPETVTVTFRQTGRQPELWDAVSGTKRDLPEYAIKDGRTSVELQFDSYASMFIVFAKPAEKTAGKNFARSKPLQQIRGPWTVQFDKEWLYPVDGLKSKEAQGSFVFDKLADWSEHVDPAVKYYSGTANYNTQFSFNGNVDPDVRYVLDLGEVYIAASVRLNGFDLGVVWCEPWSIDVAKALKSGVNKLEIKVVNQWPNRLIGDGKLPEDQRRTKTNVTDYYRSPKEGKHNLLPSGLLGPVQLTKEN